MDKIKRFFRRLWLNIRGTSPAALVMVLLTLLSGVALTVYLVAAPEAATQGTLSPLFPAVRREGIKEILIHNDYGVEYSVKSEYAKDADGNVTQNLSFWLEKDGALVPLDSEKLSYLVVGTGMNYVYDPVISAPDAGEADYEEKLALYEKKKKEFGFTEDAPYYELTKRADDTTIRVYFGKTALSGDGYYVMLEGREAVYVTSSTFVGDLLQMAGPETLVSPILVLPSTFQYAYAYMNSYKIFDTKRETAVGTKVTADYTSVWFTYLAEDGKTRVKDSIMLNNAKDAAGEEIVPDGMTLALRAFLLDRRLGVLDTPETFSYTYPADEKDEDLRGTTVSFDLVSLDVLEIEEVKVAFGFVEETERPQSHKNSIYLFHAPSRLTSYLPETGTLMTVMESTLGATGTVTRLGITGDVIDELGLYAHRLSFSYPYTDNLAGGYLPGELLVSRRTENGTRYVGSLVSDMVLEVDAATFDFLDEDLFYYTDASLQTAAIGDVESMTFYWNFGEELTEVDGERVALLSGSYRFDITMGIKENANGEAYETVTAVHVTDASGNRREIVKYRSFNQLFYRLGYSRYAAEHHLTEEEIRALTETMDNCALALHYKMRDGSVAFLEFYPIPGDGTGDLVLVRTRNGADGGVGEAFAVYGTTLKDIARGYLTVTTGGDLTAADRYS